MAKAEEGSRKLSILRNSVLQVWQKEGRNALPHLERSLLARQGAATLVAGQLLDLLLASFPPVPATVEGNGRLYVETALAAPSPAESMRPAEAPSSGEASITSSRKETASSSVPHQPDVSPADEVLPQQGSIEALAALPCAWADVRLLLNLLGSHLERALIEKRPDALLISGCWRRLEEIGGRAADLRMERMRRDLDSQGEELMVAQHLGGRFLANASHELRTPLQAVLGFAELLVEESYGPLTPEQTVAIGHIENSAQNLLEIINNLLDMLHVRAGKRELEYRPFEVRPVLENLYQILLPLSERKKVRFEMEVTEDLGRIEADEHILRHIVYHLLSSALRATPSGGHVTLRAWRTDAALGLEMQDTAMHLPPEALANMMEPFSRLENSPARGYESWEIGLPLVRRYVELHLGTLEMESLPERGSVFRVYLPLSKGRGKGKREKGNEETNASRL